jgi:hypothetical protein
MNTKHTVLASWSTGALVIAAVLTACGEKHAAAASVGTITSEDVRHDVGQAVNTAGKYSWQKKDEFEKALAAGLADLDAKIDKLREKGRNLTGQAKADWDRTMADLETTRVAARAKLVEVRSSSEQAWKDTQQGAQSAWHDLDNAFQAASREF